MIVIFLQQHPMTKENKPLRLLVVEDNPGDFVLLKKYLQRASTSVEVIRWAHRLSEVEALLKEHEIDIAFLDLTLPDSTGINSFVTLNQYLPHVPIIVLSGLADTEVALETISLGAQDFLMKGEFDEKLLAKSIQYSFERKKTMEKLKESNERFRYVTQATFDAIWDCKLETNELYWAENFKTLFGHTPGNESDNFRLWQQLIHPEEREIIIKRLEEVLKGTESNWVEEYRFQKAGGEYSYVLDKAIVLRDTSGKAYRMIGAMQDITRQKEEEHTLKLFQSVIVNANDGVFITEAKPIVFPGPKIIYVNEAMSRIAGYSREEFIGQAPGILYGQKSDAKELEKLCTSMLKWEMCEIEILNYKKNGEEIWMNYSVVPIANEKGWFTHWITIARDVTEQRKHTKEIEEQNIKLKEIAWMQSHVVRAPLARIMGLINAINDFDAMKMSQAELLGHIVHSAHELDAIIRDIVTKSSEIKLSIKI
ncbi:MAG: hypothetical protein JWQ09_5537 [Segetibacter sp.]|nr:hypothetical protein [Segetibacter sp.]